MSKWTADTEPFLPKSMEDTVNQSLYCSPNTALIQRLLVEILSTALPVAG
jgi:hypothetical protein